MKNILTQTKTDALNFAALNTARRTTPAQWDFFAVIGLMVCCAAYSVCAIMAF